MLRSITSVVATAALLLTAAPAIAGPATPVAARSSLATGPTVKIAVNQSTFRGGDRVKVSGKVSTERRVRRVVVLHARVAGVWAELDVRRTDRRGRYAFRLKAPNPATRAKVAFKVSVLRSKNKKLRKAWRKPATSSKVVVVFRNNPAIARPQLPSLALPAACVTAEPGVMAKTADCVAAIEVQRLERSWLDGQRLFRITANPSANLQLGIDLGGEPTTPAQLYADLRIIAPLTTEVTPQSVLVTPEGTDQLLMDVIFGALFLEPFLESEFGAGATSSGQWSPEWTQALLLTDLSQVTLTEDAATTPQRPFTTAIPGGRMTLTLGGGYTYVSGMWVPEKGTEIMFQRRDGEAAAPWAPAPSTKVWHLGR